MPGRPSLGTLARNGRLKVAAFGLALFLWVLVRVGAPGESDLVVPINIRLDDPGWVVLGDPVPATVLAFAEPLGITHLRFSDSSLHMWGAEAQTGVLEFAITLAIVIGLFWLIAGSFFLADACRFRCWRRFPPASHPSPRGCRKSPRRTCP